MNKELIDDRLNILRQKVSVAKEMKEFDKNDDLYKYLIKSADELINELYIIINQKEKQ